MVTTLVIVDVVLNRSRKGRGRAPLREGRGGCPLSSGGLCLLRLRLSGFATRFRLGIQFGALGGGAGFRHPPGGFGRLL
jgi:hypothetical protein